MLRKVIEIDPEKCNGCGACAVACHEGAIGIVDGKAKLLRDDYCDGLGDCLPTCPTGAISFVEREAAAYDHEAVMENKRTAAQANESGCPGSKSRVLQHAEPEEGDFEIHSSSMLRQWPVQIKLAPVTAAYYQGAKLLIAADCCAYAYAAFHERFIKGHICLVGCPKLDSLDYSEKLAEIIRQNDITGISLARMEVPCCGGLEVALKKALKVSGKDITLQVETISTDGRILSKLRKL